MFCVTFNLSSANAFNLGWSEILSTGKGLTAMLATVFLDFLPFQSKIPAIQGPQSPTIVNNVRYREYVYSVAVYQKCLTRLGELIIFEPWRENYHFSRPS